MVSFDFFFSVSFRTVVLLLSRVQGLDIYSDAYLRSRYPSIRVMEFERVVADLGFVFFFFSFLGLADCYRVFIYPIFFCFFFLGSRVRIFSVVPVRSSSFSCQRGLGTESPVGLGSVYVPVMC